MRIRIPRHIKVYSTAQYSTVQHSTVQPDAPQGETGILKANGIPILLDLAFASNVRYLDESEMYVTMMMMMMMMMMMSRYMNCVELYTTLPYASGVAMARGVLDSLMSATYFNASALRSNKHKQNLNFNEI